MIYTANVIAHDTVRERISHIYAIDQDAQGPKASSGVQVIYFQYDLIHPRKITGTLVQTVPWRSFVLAHRADEKDKTLSLTYSDPELKLMIGHVPQLPLHLIR